MTVPLTFLALLLLFLIIDTVNRVTFSFPLSPESEDEDCTYDP